MSKANNEQLTPEAYSHLRGCSPGLCKFIVERLAIFENHRVLDVGSGPGDNTALISAFTGASVEGSDVDEERVSYARTSHPSVSFHEASAEQLPFESGSFNRITMMLSVHRFENVARAMQEAHRVIKSDGRLAIATVTPDQLAARLDFSVFPTALRLECQRFPTAESLIEELDAHAFTAIESFKYREVIRPVDDTFLQWLKAYPFSVLKRIPDSEFRQGLNAIAALIRTSPTVQLHTDEYTVITAVTA